MLKRQPETGVAEAVGVVTVVDEEVLLVVDEELELAEVALLPPELAPLFRPELKCTENVVEISILQ